MSVEKLTLDELYDIEAECPLSIGSKTGVFLEGKKVSKNSGIIPRQISRNLKGREIIADNYTIRNIRSYHQFIRDRQSKIRGRRVPWFSGVSSLKRGVCFQVIRRQTAALGARVLRLAKVRLANGDEVIAYVPHDVQDLKEHSIVLLRAGRVMGAPDVRYQIVRKSVNDAAGPKKIARHLILA